MTEDPAIYGSGSASFTQDDSSYTGPYHNAPMPLSKINAIVLAHAKAWETNARHRQNWDKSFQEIQLVFPTDDTCIGALSLGSSCHHGPATIDRMKFAIALALQWPQACVMEYDTLVWDLPEVIESGVVLCSRVFPNHDGQFGAQDYGHSPWLATKETWWRILQAGDDLQGGWPDRWLACAARKAGVKLKGLRDGFSADWTWDKVVIENAVAARKRGAQAIHGFKSKEVYDLLCQP